MDSCLNLCVTTERYNDGVTMNYSSMIRMWSTFDRAIKKFQIECGVLDARSQRHDRGSRQRNARSTK